MRARGRACAPAREAIAEAARIDPPFLRYDPSRAPDERAAVVDLLLASAGRNAFGAPTVAHPEVSMVRTKTTKRRAPRNPALRAQARTTEPPPAPVPQRLDPPSAAEARANERRAEAIELPDPGDVPPDLERHTAAILAEYERRCGSIEARRLGLELVREATRAIPHCAMDDRRHVYGYAGICADYLALFYSGLDEEQVREAHEALNSIERAKPQTHEDHSGLMHALRELMLGATSWPGFVQWIAASVRNYLCGEDDGEIRLGVVLLMVHDRAEGELGRETVARLAPRKSEATAAATAMASVS